MLWFHKLVVASRIAELPLERREKTRRVWNILNELQAYWTFYPLYTAAAVCFGFMFLSTLGVTSIPALGMDPVLAGITWSFIVYLAVFPLAKVVFLGRTKRLLRELKEEFATADGKRAGEFLNEWDSGATRNALRAARRSPLCWIW